MTAEAKIAQGKMTLLQLAERSRNVSEACRRRGAPVSRRRIAFTRPPRSYPNLWLTP